MRAHQRGFDPLASEAQMVYPSKPTSNEAAARHEITVQLRDFLVSHNIGSR